MRYAFHPEAELELTEAALRYESIVPNLGRHFVNEVERVIGILLEHPEAGARVDNELRHFVLRRFPFSVVYAASGDSLFISEVKRYLRVILLEDGETVHNTPFDRGFSP